MNTYKVLDEKFTRPSNLSREVKFFLKELFPLVNRQSNDVTIRIESHNAKCKRRICTCQRANMDSKTTEDNLCEVFKKLRLDCEDPEQREVRRVYHCESCHASIGGCCSASQNFAGANKSLEVCKENFKFSRIPVRNFPLNTTLNKENNSPAQSRIPVRKPFITGNRKKILEKKEAAPKTPKMRPPGTKKSCLKTENQSPYIKDILRAFPKPSRRVSFSEFVEDPEKKIRILEKDYSDYRKSEVRAKQPAKNRLSLPAWRY